MRHRLGKQFAHRAWSRPRSSGRRPQRRRPGAPGPRPLDPHSGLRRRARSPRRSPRPRCRDGPRSRSHAGAATSVVRIDPGKTGGGGETGDDRGRGRAQTTSVRDRCCDIPAAVRARGARGRRVRAVPMRMIRWDSSLGTWSAPSPDTSIWKPSSRTLRLTRSRQSSASPKQSNPGPRLALVAGTSTVAGAPVAGLGHGAHSARSGRRADASPAGRRDDLGVHRAAAGQRGVDVLQAVTGDRETTICRPGSSPARRA